MVSEHWTQSAGERPFLSITLHADSYEFDDQIQLSYNLTLTVSSHDRGAKRCPPRAIPFGNENEENEENEDAIRSDKTLI